MEYHKDRTSRNTTSLPREILQDEQSLSKVSLAIVARNKWPSSAKAVKENTETKTYIGEKKFIY